jgi:hypothetical protein
MEMWLRGLAGKRTEQVSKSRGTVRIRDSGHCQTYPVGETLIVALFVKVPSFIDEQENCLQAATPDGF